MGTAAEGDSYCIQNFKTMGKKGNGDPTLDIRTNGVTNSFSVPIMFVSWGVSVLLFSLLFLAV